MRGKYSPTVSEAYMRNQDWWDQYANPDGTWNSHDPEGYDSYGYDRNDRDRAGNLESDYYTHDYETESGELINVAYDDALNEWTFDGIKPVTRS